MCPLLQTSWSIQNMDAILFDVWFCFPFLSHFSDDFEGQKMLKFAYVFQNCSPKFGSIDAAFLCLLVTSGKYQVTSWICEVEK